MYDDSSITDTESLSTDCSIASILGIKGNLRLRPHTASHKAHVVLRRVENPDFSISDGEENNVVYFSLFANKLINIKPGKELLLTVDAPDGRFKDQVVRLEGTLRGPEDEDKTQVEEEPQVIEEEEDTVPQATIPPKMRRQWTRKADEVSPVIFKPPVSYTSVGVQAEQPIYVSSSVQACPTQNSASVQAQPSTISTSVHAYPCGISAAVQVDPPPPPSYTSLDVQTDPDLDPTEDHVEERSSSPMELESPDLPSVGLPWVPIKLEVIDVDPKDTRIVLPPIYIKQELDEVVEPIPPQSDLIRRACIQDARIKKEEQDEVVELIPPQSDLICGARIQDARIKEQDEVVEIIPPPRDLTRRARVQDMFDLENTPEPPEALVIPHIPPRAVPRPVLHNPFVSAGFVTDFVSTVVSSVRDPPPRVKMEEPTVANIPTFPPNIPLPSVPPAVPVMRSGSSPAPSTSSVPSWKLRQRVGKKARRAKKRRAAALANDSNSPQPSTLMEPSVPNEESCAADTVNTNLIFAENSIDIPDDSLLSQTAGSVIPPEPLPPPPPLPRSRPPVPNAVASSSKVVIPPSPVIKPLSVRAKEKAPAVVVDAASTQTDGGYSSLSWTASAIGFATLDDPKPSSPPPDPKELAYIPAGPSSNRLNIRPSSTARPPPRPFVPTLISPKSRRAVVVGRGWPFTAARTTVASSSTSARAQTQTATGPVDLDSLVAYTSPSPPPPPVSAPPSKWRRVTDEISIGVGPGDEPSSGGANNSDTDEVEIVIPDPVPPATDPPPLSLKDRISLRKLRERIMPAAVESAPLLSRIGPDVSSASAAPLQSRQSKGKQTDSTSPATGVNKIQVSSKSTNAKSTSSSASPSVRCTSNSHRSASNIQPPARAVSDVILPTRHPLPAKPSPSTSTSAGPRGIKRPASPNQWTAPGVVRVNGPRGTKRAASPDLWTAPGIVRIEVPSRPAPASVPPAPLVQGSHRWPTLDRMHAATLQGDGDVGIRGITFAEDGAYFAVSCWDRTLRIWNSSTQLEIARLAHNAAVIGVVWLEGAAGVMVLGEDGVLGKWTRSGDQNQWQWARIMHVGTEQAAVLAYARDRIAVAFPGWGVRVWMWSKGTWIAQRSVMRMEVTALRFVEGGDGLLGGTKDGVVWYCAVPGGTLRAYAFLQTSITSIDVNPSTGAYALVAGSGSASMVRLGVEDNKRVKHTYTNKQKQATAEFGGVYCPGGKTIMYGTVDGCVLVWDVKGQGVVYGMEHDADDEIHAVASCDGGTEGYVVTGSRGGRLAWWPQPTGQDAATHAPRKRTKVK